MVDKLRLEVLLAAIDKVTGPLQAIAKGSQTTAKALGETELALKKLQAQQRALARFEQERDQLDNARSQLDQAKALNVSQTVVKQLTAAYEKQLGVVKRLQADMMGRGWGDATVDQKHLADAIKAANSQLDAQRSKLEQQRKVEDRLHALRTQHSSDMAKLGMRGAMAAGAMMAGQRMGNTLMQPVAAFSRQEDASSQLRASMMQADGSVPAELRRISELADKLGNRLPGSTADFLEMMTMLRRQGMSAQAILGGLGESAAYLGVQLKMPVTAAAEFAAKMQDATQTAEGDMMGLMDTIQRAYYLGVDPSNMLQGFKNMAAVMPFLGKKGLEASQHLAPLLVMMDQAGMSGESAGNAIRKVVQLSLDAEKLGKANKLLAPNGIALNFATREGKFAGLENLFAQLDKLKTVESDVQRMAAMKKLFGDDAETHQVLNTLMEKGQAGYLEVLNKMKAQSDLKRRVDEQLGTLTNVADAAKGVGENVLAAVGETIAPELKQLAKWLGEVGEAAGAWIRDNPRIVKTLMLMAAGAAALMVVVGGLGLALVSVLGPLAIVRFLTARLGLGLLQSAVDAKGATGALGLLARASAWLGASWASLRAIGVGGIFRAMGTALMSPMKMLGMMRTALGGIGKLLWGIVKRNPVAAVVIGIGTAFMELYERWDEIKAYFNAGEWRKFWGVMLDVFLETLNSLTLGLSGWLLKLAGIEKTKDKTEAANKVSALALSVASIATVPVAASTPEAAQAARPIIAIAQQAPAKAPGTLGSGTYQITINAAPGMDERALARAVTAELDRRDRAMAARRLSRLSDID